MNNKKRKRASHSELLFHVDENNQDCKNNETSTRIILIDYDEPNMPTSSSSSRRTKWGRHAGSSQVDEAAVNAMFDAIADPEDDSIANMEGISTLCEHLGIDPVEDVRILVLLHKLGARSKPAQITREEWVEGCHRLRVDSLDKFKALLPSLELGFMEGSEFREFFKFCFKFNLEGTHKTLDKDLVIALVDLTLKGRIDPQRLLTFQEFLNTTKDTSYNRITLDQWISFLDFSIECPDLSQYDEENSAWPVLIDDYVDFSNRMKM